MPPSQSALAVRQARDKLSGAINRAALDGEVTYISRGRAQQRVAAIVPADLVGRYKAMVDAEGRLTATERLADSDAGRTTGLPADEVARALGL